MKPQLAALDVVDRAVTLSDYIPEDQEEKLEILADIAFWMDVGGGGRIARLEGVGDLGVLRKARMRL